MATKIKIVTTGDFLEITPEGVIDMATSRQLLVDIAKTDRHPVDYDLLIDFRDTQWRMSTLDLYNLASELFAHGDTFRRKVARATTLKRQDANAYIADYVAGLEGYTYLEGELAEE